jgi:hypothetical protein
MTGYDSKRKMAADKLHWSDCAVHNGPAYPAGECDCGAAQGPVTYSSVAYKLAQKELGRLVAENFGRMPQDKWADSVLDLRDHLESQPAQEPEMLTIVYQSGYHDGKQAALAGREWNFCERCGKRTKDLTVIHTCTPPQEKNL